MPESVWVSCIVMTISVRFHCEHDTAQGRTDGITSMLNLLPLSPQVPQDIRPDILSLQSYPVRILQSSRAYPGTNQPCQSHSMQPISCSQSICMDTKLTVIERLGTRQQPPPLIPIIPGLVRIRSIRLAWVSFTACPSSQEV